MNEPRPTIRPLGASHPTTVKPAPDPLVDPLAANAQSIKPEEPLVLVEEASVNAVSEQQKKIRAFDEGAKHRHHEFKRPVHTTNTGATRVKSFHGKYSEQGLAYLDDAINEWLDAHPEADIKFVTSTVGLFDGKIKENALVLNIWY